MIIKFCKKCKQHKLLNKENFYVRKDRPIGYSSFCKDCKKKDGRIYGQLYYPKNKEKRRQYHIKNRAKILERKQNYRQTEQYKSTYKKYYKKKKDYLIKQSILYNKQQYKTNICFKLKHNLRRRIHEVIKYNKKCAPTERLLGCSLEFFKKYLESKFQPQMTWENYSFYGWHIDHIKPCFSFDLSDPEQQKQCFHYTNLQPLWAKENLRKCRK